jgi:hypothetical protein
MQLSKLQKFLIVILFLMLLSRSWTMAAAQGWIKSPADLIGGAADSVIEKIGNVVQSVVTFMSYWFIVFLFFVLAFFFYPVVPIIAIVLVLAGVVALVFGLWQYGLFGSNKSQTDPLIDANTIK